LDEDCGSIRHRPWFRFGLIAVLAAVALGVFVKHTAGTADPSATAASIGDIFPPLTVAALALFVGASAFFSGSELAFFSLTRLELRALRDDGSAMGRYVARLMERPNRLLTTILVGNMIVNVLIGVFMGSSVERFFSEVAQLPAPFSYIAAIIFTTTVLVFCGEIAPKVFAVRVKQTWARVAVVPISLADWVLAPVRSGAMSATSAILRGTGISNLPPPQFITDEEFMSVLEDGEAQGVIEEDERQMIEGILESGDALLREILTPRPDVVYVNADATLSEACTLMRQHQYSRMPVIKHSPDDVAGLLVCKDLLPHVAEGAMDRPVSDIMRKIHFVPETMTVQQFVSDAQRHRAHLAVVVDEYGGTAGIVSLEDALEQVVGDIVDLDEVEQPEYERMGEGVYRVEGGMDLDELNEVIGAELENESHQTVAGFVMEQIDKVPEPGDTIRRDGIEFTVEACDGKRASQLRIALPARGRRRKPPASEAEDS
jgi:CBS domain containing-hemolysin-like protein